ncbi:MAG: hypothetical protein AB7S48_16070 [Bacteroidales bacterium]
MKTSITKLIILIVIGALLNVNASAQDKPKKDDAQKKKEKEQQKKELDSIAEQSKTEYEYDLQRLLEEQERAMNEQEKAFDEIEKLSDIDEFDVLPYGDFFSGKKIRVKIPDIPNIPDFNYDALFGMNSMSGDNTSFSISKRLKEETTFSGDFEFSIPEKCKGVFFNFSGSLEAGSLKVTFTKPDKKVFHEFKVSPIADVRWNKSLKDDELKDLSGVWKVTISVQGAKGKYNINISSF